jgi:predicted nucleotidyltransferase
MATTNADLSAHELSAITRWAEEIPPISEIRLFGKRAKSTTLPNSDIDLAVTVINPQSGSPGFGVFFSLLEQWQRQLAERTGCRVRVWWYGPESPVYEHLQAESILIWSRMRSADSAEENSRAQAQFGFADD